MRICLFISSLYGGGAERVVCNLANYLVVKENEVTILTFGEASSSYLLSSKVKVKVLMSSLERKKHNIYTAFMVRIFRLYKIFKQHNFSVVVAMLPIPIILSLAMKPFINGKLVVSERSFPGAYSKLIRYVLCKLMPLADGCIFQTKEAYKWYASKIDVKKYKIIPNAINKDAIVEKYSGIREKKVVAVGRLEKQKNFELLIRSFAVVTQDNPEYTLHIFGEGKEKGNLTELIRDLMLEERVFLEGNVKNVVEVISKATLFVLSSDYEGIPNALLEAMACGLPWIATDCLGGGARLLIENGYNGYLVPPNDINEMSKCMRYLLLSDTQRMICGMNAMLVREKFSPKLIYSEWLSFIKNV